MDGSSAPQAHVLFRFRRRTPPPPPRKPCLLRCRFSHGHENDEIGPHAKLLGIRNLIVEFYVNATKQQRLRNAQLTHALSLTMKHYNAIQKH
ncbi:hypothetical protein ACSQ67_003450 [Phaseolus vulgaris]